MATVNVVKTLAAETASGASAPVSVDGDKIAVLIRVTAVAGTPSFIFGIEWTQDGTNFAPAIAEDVFDTITTAISVVKSFTLKGIAFRLVWAVSGGSPSMTFAATEFSTGTHAK